MSNLAQQDHGSITSSETRKCPVPFFKRLLAEAPVYRDPVMGGYVVTRYADIVTISEHPEIFHSNNEILIGRSSSPVADEVKRRFRENGCPEVHTLVTADPPEHGRYRSLADKIFTASFVKSIDPKVHDIANELIDGFAQRGHVDLPRDFAILLPMYIIVDRLGLPREDWKKIKRWSDVSVARADPTLSPESELALTDEYVEMQNYLRGHIQRYRDAPQDNLLSSLANVESDGVHLTDGEAVSIAQQLMVAGNETTTTVMMSALNEILTRPGLKDAVMADFGLLPGVVEETLRMHTPVPMFYRTVATDTVLGGTPIPKGSIVCLSYIGANHDPAQWDEPDSFNPSRKNVRLHLGFGRGPHFCIGHLMAKAELRISLEILLKRLPNLRLSPSHAQPQFTDHPFIHTLDGMHLDFDPR